MLPVQGSSRLDNGQHRRKQTIEESGREWASAPGGVRGREGAGEGSARQDMFLAKHITARSVVTS